jgi:hypothetical protein
VKQKQQSLDYGQRGENSRQEIRPFK